MKVTKEYLKQLIREQIKEQEDAAAAAEDAFDKAAEEAGVDAKLNKPGTSKGTMDSQELKSRILGMARDVSGIMRNEIDIVEFALAILDAAKSKNLNSGVLRSKLELVRDEMARIKS